MKINTTAIKKKKTEVRGQGEDKAGHRRREK